MPQKKNLQMVSTLLNALYRTYIIAQRSAQQLAVTLIPRLQAIQ